jgi:hypothetical protein
MDDLDDTLSDMDDGGQMSGCMRESEGLNSMVEVLAKITEE